MNIAVVGNSFAAYAVVAALTKLGYDCDLLCDPVLSNFSGPSLVINDVGEALLRELFPDINLHAYCHSLSHRWVRWGTQAQPMCVEQPALAIRSQSLLNLLRNSKVMQDICVIDANQLTAEELSQNYAWTVYAKPQQGAIALPTSCESLVGGERVIITAEVEHTLEDPQACYIESLANGWLFYAPMDESGAILQACWPTKPVEARRVLLECLYHSSLIAPFVSDVQNVNCFSSAPYFQQPLCGLGWLKIGESAIKIDPVSGEGTPFALRSAILAAAVIDAILCDRIPDESALNHYQTRLTHSFIAHLQGCIQFYTQAFNTNAAWLVEINQMSDIAETTSTRLMQQTADVLNCRLIDFQLHIQS